MTILLVQPAINFERTYPLGLAYLAGHLARRGHRVRGFDARLDGPSAFRRALAPRDLRLVGVSLYSTNLEAGLSLARLARRLRPDLRVVLGGPHVTLAPETLVRESCWDYLVRGDGEVPLAGLLEGETEGVGVVRRSEMEPGRGPGRGQGQGPGRGRDKTIYVHHDLDALEHADRRVFPVARYYGDILKARNRWTSMVTTRGCSRSCGYCSAARLSAGSHRARSAESVVSEMARLRRDHQLEGVYLEDDNLLQNRAWAVDLLQALASRNPGLSLELPNGLDPMELDDELIGLMRAAGVAALSLGIESTLEKNQRYLKRPVQRGHLERVLGRCRALGIRTTGYFILGLPHDSVPGLLKMFADVKRLDLDLAHVSVLEPLPGAAAQPSPGAYGALKASFYLYFYADVSRARSVMQQGAGLRKIARRYAQWLLR